MLGCAAAVSTDNYSISYSRTVTVLDNREHPIDIRFAMIEGVNDTLLLVDSHGKTLKEKSMHKKASDLFEDGLEAIRKSIDKTGGTKLRDKVNERIGRLKQRCGSIHRDYDIHLEYDKDDKVTSITCTHNEKKLAARTDSEGKYRGSRKSVGISVPFSLSI